MPIKSRSVYRKKRPRIFSGVRRQDLPSSQPSPATTPATSPATSSATSPATSPAISPATTLATSPATTSPTSPATTSATSPATTPITVAACTQSVPSQSGTTQQPSTIPTTPVSVTTRSGKKIGLARARAASVGGVSATSGGADAASGNVGVSRSGVSVGICGGDGDASGSVGMEDSELQDFSNDTLLFKPSSLSKRISVFSCCGSPLTVTVEPSSRRGLVTQVAICCNICGTYALVTDPYDDDDLEMNGRSVLAMRSIGRGRAGLATFCGMMGMPPPISDSNYSTHNKKLKLACDKERSANQSAAAPVAHVGPISGDGWRCG